jgi:hypothetical protein
MKFFRNLLLVTALFAGICPAALGVVGFTITPNTVSNTYAGNIQLQISGLTSGGTVVVQKYLDANTNGIIDGADLPVQQFNMTDGQAGMVIGGITNNNVPGDTDGVANGTITANLIIPNGDFIQNLVGKYLVKVSGNFTPPITNVFTVTNSPFLQKFTGNVVSNSSSTTLSNAVVVLFPPPRPGHKGLGQPLAGTVANNAGAYSIMMPAGTYTLVAFATNYVANVKKAPVVFLSAGLTVSTNLTLTNTTATFTGKVVDAGNNNIGLPGVFLPVMSTNNLLSSTFTDSNGNFTAHVTAGQWNVGSDDSGLIVHGYVGSNNGTNVNNGANVLVPYPKANAMFYGSIKDITGKPMVGIDVNDYDTGNNLYQMDGFTDTNGNYFVGALGLGGSDPWQLGLSGESGPTNYIFSQPQLDQNGGTNLTAGQALQVNFTAILATNRISGHVQFNGTNVIGVQVYAYATIGGASYQSQADTDGNGNYSFNVANGDWNVNVYDCGCSDNNSLNNIIGGGNYQDPSSQNVNINNNNGTANFTVQLCGGVSIITTSPLPDGQVGVYYDIQLQASSCNNNFTWSLNDPADFPSSLTLEPWGEINGTPDTGGTNNFSVHVDDNNGHSTNQSFSLYIAGVSSPLQVTTMDLPNGTNGTFYSQTLQASGGQTPYSWSIPNYSADPPPNLTLATNGVLSGTLTTAGGPFSFDVAVTDGATNTAYQTLSVYIVNPPLPPLVITNVALPNGNVGAAYSAQLGATGGQPPYNWQLATGSANPPAGLTLYSSGLISGTPTTNKVSTFKVQATDANFTTTNKVLSITINSKPVLGSASWLTNQFQMRLTGASNQNYTVQMSTNLSSTNWISLFITNNMTTNSFLLTDPDATNQQRFYRILIGQ